MTGGMFYGGVGVCPCHGEPWYLSSKGRKRGQKRQCIFKVRAQWTRRDARRDKTPKRLKWKAISNAKRVRVGQFYVGMAPKPEQAAIINKHARDEMKRCDAERRAA